MSVERVGRMLYTTSEIPVRTLVEAALRDITASTRIGTVREPSVTLPGGRTVKEPSALFPRSKEGVLVSVWPHNVAAQPNPKAVVTRIGVDSHGGSFRVLDLCSENSYAWRSDSHAVDIDVGPRIDGTSVGMMATSERELRGVPPVVEEWFAQLEEAARSIEVEQNGNWLLSRLENAGEHYTYKKVYGDGSIELGVDGQKLRKDWPFYGGDDYQPPVVLITRDGALHSQGRYILGGRLDDGFSSLAQSLNASLIAQIVELLPGDLVALTHEIHPTLATYNLIRTTPEFTKLYEIAPLTAVHLVNLAHSEAQHDTQANFERIPELLRLPLREIVGTVAGIKNRFEGILEAEPMVATPSLLAYSRHSIEELGGATDGSRDLGYGLQPCSQKMFEFVAEANVDRVRELRDPKGWRLVRKAVAVNHVLGHKVLENPSAAVRAIEGYFAPHIRAVLDDTRDDLPREVMADVHDYMHRDENSIELARQAKENPKLLPSFRRLCIASKQWHRELRNQQLDADALATADDTDEFAPCELDGLIVGDYRLRQLRSVSALKLEGAVMGHCVGSYGPRCIRGESIVFSLEASDGHGSWDSVATVELHRGYKIKQLYGRRDRRVKTEIRDQLEQAIAANAPESPYASREAWLSGGELSA